ncbi:MAG TPA: hypothetical protein VL463_00180 [Kofleriaceae bacterium]|jgi:hypothetical protein|nr:hypothetical protein [Kofleriaceae bacterium]
MLWALILPVVAAFDRGDHDEVAREGAKLGAAGLAPLLRSDRADAAIEAAASAPDGYELLVDLAAVAGGWDRARAAPAARVAAHIADAMDDATERDLPDDALAAAQDAWAAIARAPDRWADVRVHALEVAAHVARARHAGLGYDLAAFLHDPDPEVRRAAIELVPAPLPADLLAPIAAAISADDDDTVALAAAQIVCGELASAPADPIVAAVGDRGLDRIRALVRSHPKSIEAKRCLRYDRQ